MPIDFSQDHFALFDLPRRFHLEADRLEEAYHAMQAKVHPDRFASQSETERRLSMQWATQVNEAYRVLRQPLTRANYLLQLAGIDTGAESNTAMPAEFLMEQMEWRDAVSEAREAADQAALDDLMKRLEQHAREIHDEIEQLIDERQDYAAAAESVRRLMFMRRLKLEIEDAFEALEEN